MAPRKKSPPAATSTSRRETVVSASSDQTRRIGARLARGFVAGDVVFLKGDLGSGKTTLVQGIARGLGIRHFVRSSSFILVNEYASRPLKLYHMDLYRLAGGEVENLGLEEYLYGDGVTVIEWAERMESLEMPATYEIRMSWVSETERKIEICRLKKRGGRGKAVR
jgi:tRNA threonylcarbamoyladenosine biosynthesis protein TsaE